MQKKMQRQLKKILDEVTENPQESMKIICYDTDFLRTHIEDHILNGING